MAEVVLIESNGSSYVDFEFERNMDFFFSLNLITHISRK